MSCQWTIGASLAILLSLGARSARADDAPAERTEPPTAASPGSRVARPCGPDWGYSVKGGLTGVAEFNAWWGLAKTFAPTSGFGGDRSWVEAWSEVGLRGSLPLGDCREGYARVSAIGSANVGRDVFDQGDSGRVLLEDGYVGVRDTGSSPFRLDVSVGAQPYAIGDGFLVSMGAQNGGERGATSLAPRKAWAFAGLARLSAGSVSADAFVLDDHEIDGSPDTKLFGSRVEKAWAGDAARRRFVGLAGLHVFESTMPYAQAPAAVIDNGREGLDVLHAYGRWESAPGARQWSVSGNFVYEWNPAIDMRAWAGSLEVGCAFRCLPWTPSISLRGAAYSGDDPKTARLEKFDPLFWDGGQSAWACGSNASFAFYNSNLIALRLRAVAMPSPRDIVEFAYTHVRAAETDSPLQFGQSARLGFVGDQPTLLTGVPDAHLSDDFYLGYTRLIGEHVTFTLGAGVSVPGEGLDRIISGGGQTWTGLLATFTATF